VSETSIVFSKKRFPVSPDFRLVFDRRLKLGSVSFVPGIWGEEAPFRISEGAFFSL
jgi:hypothetical protein